MDLGECYHEAERFLRQEDAKADKEEEVNVVKGGLSKEGSCKGKEKRKVDDGFDGSKRQRRELKFSSYTDLNEILNSIYLDARGSLLYQRLARKEPIEHDRTSGKYCILHELDGHDTDDYRHLKYIIKKHMRNNQLPQYVRVRVARWNRSGHRPHKMEMTLDRGY